MKNEERSLHFAGRLLRRSEAEQQMRRPASVGMTGVAGRGECCWVGGTEPSWEDKCCLWRDGSQGGDDNVAGGEKGATVLAACGVKATGLLIAERARTRGPMF